MRLKIYLDEDLYGFLAGIHLDFDRRILKIYLMAPTILSAPRATRGRAPLVLGRVVPHCGRRGPLDRAGCHPLRGDQDGHRRCEHHIHVQTETAVSNCS